VCVPGQQFSCACPGTSSKGVQACLPDGKGLGSCEGCPSGQGGTGSGGKGGSAGQGQAGQGQAGSSDKPDAGDFFDSLPFPLPDSGPVGQCVGCLKDNCDSQINSCYNNPDCAQGIQCAVTQCLGGNILGGMGGGPGPGGMGGGPDPACLLQCFNGDPGAAFAAVQTFQCVTQTCGGDCGGGFFGDGGGNFPLGGLGGGPPPGMNGDPNARYIDGVRVPLPSEVPGYPWLQQALTPKQLRNRLRV